MLTRYDKILLVVILIACIAGFIFVKIKYIRSYLKPGIVIIEVEGKEVRRINLPSVENVKIKGARGVTLVEVQEHKVRVFESDCPNQTCVKQGWISYKGQNIICVPNQVVVRIEGENESYDAITR